MGVKLTVNPEGSFKIDNIDELSYTYFPLCNEHGLKASITPSLNGSLNIDQNTFFLLPTSNEDSHNSLMNRNVYLNVNDAFIWSITGNTPHQMIHQDQVKLEGDFLIHKITRQNELFESSIESFISSKDNIEYHKFRVTNNNNQSLTIKPVLNVPMYNRSADNIRDHRHVSSLFNRATLHPTGMTNQPTFLFDEEGHHKADHRYDIQFFTTSTSVKNYWPILEEFIGEGYNLLSPNVVTNNNVSSYKSDDTVTGYELTGGFEFEPITLKKNDTFELIFALGINSQLNQKPLSQEVYDEHKAATLEYWQELLQQLTCDMKDNNYTAWLKWVTIQPTLRRLYGNSFLPHHDYGKGGRGWRDLWQDQLSLILMDSTTVREALINNFKGVRI
ncbi:MAG: cellobiose phosphorylase, partial [Candidatus Izimaplasma sp.]|nr:cellobiose phosphorylase [Candidatus Izimaplasma bacterium]